MVAGHAGHSRPPPCRPLFRWSSAEHSSPFRARFASVSPVNDARHAAVPRSRSAAARSAPGRWLVAAAAALVVFAGLGAYRPRDRRPRRGGARGREPPLSTAASCRRGTTDPRPLTVDEVFRGPARRRAPRTLQDCARAVTGELVYLVGEAGCSQAVRGHVRDPRVRRHRRPLQPRRTPPPPATCTSGSARWSTPARAASRGLPARRRHRSGRPGRGTQFGWHVRGHYLAYAVIARGDGAAGRGGRPGRRRRCSGTSWRSTCAVGCSDARARA